MSACKTRACRLRVLQSCPSVLHMSSTEALKTCPVCNAATGTPCRSTPRIAGVAPYVLSQPHVGRRA